MKILDCGLEFFIVKIFMQTTPTTYVNRLPKLKQ